MTDASDVPTDLRAVRDRVDAALTAWVAGAGTTLEGYGPELADVAGQVCSFVVGGKRVRPLFAYAGWLGAGGEHPGTAAVVRAVGALELVQLAALVHDDVIDRSLTRRGRPSVHAWFAAAHRNRGWYADPDHFGVSAAVLLGDLGLVFADEMLAAADLDDATHARARRVFDDMRRDVIVGQYLDVHVSVAPPAPADALETALRVARLKSASYTVVRPLLLGAALADAPEAVATTYVEVGTLLGEAFQLRDDLLGVFGTSAETGKPAGDDLREGKQTALIALARDRTTDPAAGRLLDRIGAADLGDDEVARLTGLLRSSGAADEVERMIAERVARATDLLAGGPLDPRGRDVLTTLAHLVTDRRS